MAYAERGTIAMKRTKFSLSHYKLLTSDMGSLVPVGLTEVLPGDTIQHATSMLMRVSPLLAPVMHPVHVRLHHFFVPNRLIWDDWEDFITGGEDGADASVLPTIDFSGAAVAEGDLADYLGLPTGFDGTASALPFRGYARIFNEFYRDQDLTTELSVSTASGADSTTNTAMQNVTWEKDYFTTARSSTQKGSEVSLPLGTEAPVVTNSANPTMTGAGATNGILQAQVTTASRMFPTGISTSGNLVFGDESGLKTDLSSATAATINQLRQAVALQRYAEARSLYGARYVEYLRYLGINPSDARLQRPEYLGGGKQTIQFSEVLQSAPEASSSSVVGEMKGHGIAAMRSNRYRKFFEEHGYIFSLLSVRPKTMYFEGVDKHWSYSAKEDYFQRELQHIGQDEILNKELYHSHATPDGVFGYQDRYDHYRRSESKISGEFRSTLNHWHYARDFAADPTLNSSFVTATPTKRVNASSATDCLWIMAQHSIQARRMVHQFGTPGGVRL